MRLFHAWRIGLANVHPMLFTAIMSDKELSDAEYDKLMSEAEQQPIESSNPDTSENPEEDDIEPTSRPYATRYPAMRKLIEMQRKLTETVLSVQTEAKDQASCARAWKELEMLRRLMMGKPLTIEAGKVKGKAGSSPMISQFRHSHYCES